MDCANSVPADAIVIGDDGDVSVRTPVDLHSQPRTPVGRAVGLPSVDKPRFDLQLICRKYLEAHAVEKPRSVGGNIRRLVGPVIEVVETEESNVRKKNSGIDVDAMQLVDVISAPGFGDIAIGSR